MVKVLISGGMLALRDFRRDSVSIFPETLVQRDPLIIGYITNYFGAEPAIAFGVCMRPVSSRCVYSVAAASRLPLGHKCSAIDLWCVQASDFLAGSIRVGNQSCHGG